MTDHVSWVFPIWVLCTWGLLLMLVVLGVSVKRHLGRISDRLDECVGKQDVYFKAATVETEMIQLCKKEVTHDEPDQ